MNRLTLAVDCWRDQLGRKAVLFTGFGDLGFGVLGFRVLGGLGVLRFWGLGFWGFGVLGFGVWCLGSRAPMQRHPLKEALMMRRFICFASKRVPIAV